MVQRIKARRSGVLPAFLLAAGVCCLWAIPTFAQTAPATAPAAPAPAEPAPECGGDFETWKQGVAAEAKAAGVGQTGLDALEAATIDDKVLARDRAQGVFTQTFNQFSGRMISAYRLKHGEANLKKYADVFSRAEEEFGVPGPIVTAFWALETDFGAVQGDFHTLSALVTLAHDCRRPEVFRPQLVPLLTLIDRGTVPADVKGAWAGEIGQTQMLPIDYLDDGVDGDGDGAVDLRNDVADVIMTTAKKVEMKGWKRGQPWVEEVRVPEIMDWSQTGRSNKLPLSRWSEWGVTRPDGSPLQDNGLKAGVALPMGHRGPAFLVYDNFDVYLEWNQSFTYALTAAVLASRFAGAPAYDPRNPDPGLDQDRMKELQTRLKGRGYDVGGVDGILGTNTREAVRQEQQRLGLAVDGWPTAELLGKL